MIAIHAGAGYDGGPERSLVVLQTLRRALAIGKNLIRVSRNAPVFAEQVQQRRLQLALVFIPPCHLAILLLNMSCIVPSDICLVFLVHCANCVRLLHVQLFIAL